MKVARCAAFGFTCLISGAIYPQEGDGGSILNSDFMAFSSDQKKHFLMSAIDMLGFVAGYKDKEQGRCVWEWYYQDMADKNGLIEAYMEKYPENVPSSILIALAEEACGAFVRVDRN